MATEISNPETTPPAAAELPNICLPAGLPGYSLGDEGKPHHFIASTSRESAGTEANSLKLGDAAFIKRSDLKWTYAVVSERVEEASKEWADVPGTVILRFEVDKDTNRKSFPEPQWGKYIRVIKVEETELERLKAEEAAKEVAEEAVASVVSNATPPQAAEDVVDVVSAKAEEAPKAEEVALADSSASVGGESTKSGKSKGNKSKGPKGGSSWFSGMSGIFNAASTVGKSKKSDEAKDEARDPAAESDAAATAADRSAPVTETPALPTIAVEPMTEDPAAAALAATSFPKPSEEEAAAPAAAPEASPEAAPPAATASNEVAPSLIAKFLPGKAAAAAAAPTKASAVLAAPKVPAAVAAPAAVAKEATEPNNTKENADPIADKVATSEITAASSASEAPSSASVNSKEKKETSSLRSHLKSPLSLKRKSSIVNKLFNKNKDKKEPKAEEKKHVTITAASLPPTGVYTAGPATTCPKSPKMTGEKKEWFDPEASEVDYDKNPTDLFQALEARQFSYAEEMFKQVNKKFTKDCKTWVVARGQKKKKESQLRFRALPLHAALVFGATDDMIVKILNAYPLATRGRDIKGRLPIHLAMEHDASEQVVCLILEAFPKGFFAKDKKDMAPLDYVDGNMKRAEMKKYIPLVTAARVEEERSTWEIEKEALLKAQKVALKEDPAYTESIVERVTDEVETTYATKMELLEMNYQKEISLLKQRHDSETQALLEGFAVKLDFERKLNKLKSKA